MIWELFQVASASAHEEGEMTVISTQDYYGPLIALIILAAAIVVARRLRRRL
ncbi:hypothetical protein HYV73_02345 [Candidatus Uhrbacteria bacterium]|nr:hypothetical protein [Candidatus Uhrbacteria bacterium]